MQCILYHYIHVLCMLWLVSYCIICIKLCKLWCRSTFFVVIFYRRNRKWLLYVYIPCKQWSVWENMKVLIHKLSNSPKQMLLFLYQAMQTWLDIFNFLITFYHHECKNQTLIIIFILHVIYLQEQLFH